MLFLKLIYCFHTSFSTKFFEMNSEQQKFLREIKELIRRGNKGLRTAQAMTAAMLESLDPVKATLYAKQHALYEQQNAIFMEAQRLEAQQLDAEGLVAKVCKLTELQQDIEKVFNELNSTVEFYSMVSEELASIKQFCSPQAAKIALPALVGDDIASLKLKTERLIEKMVNHWISLDEKKARYERSVVKHDSSRFTMNVSDVRGDGACGWRAFITGMIRVLCGKELPYDPSQMADFVRDVKLLMFELLRIIIRNPANADFVAELFTIPQNGSPKTLDTYIKLASRSDYFATNIEMRLLCSLFGMVNPDLSQVNVVRVTPYFGEIYQSISASGHVEQVSNKQINILQVPGHFMSIVKLTEGVLAPIFPTEGPIIV